MPGHPQTHLPSETIAVPHQISQLTNREAEHMLAHAKNARRAEIDEYWALCLPDPVQAAPARHQRAGNADAGQEGERSQAKREKKKKGSFCQNGVIPACLYGISNGSAMSTRQNKESHELQITHTP